MKSALILSLAGSAVAVPSFGSFIDAMFGGSDNSYASNPSDLPNFPAIGTGSGIPFPTASGAPFPTGSAGASPFPYPGSDRHVKPHAEALHIDYHLAPTVAAAIKKSELKYRQLGGSPLPSFSLFDPSATPTGLPTDLPGLPSGTEPPSLPTDAPTDLPGPPTDLPGPPTDYPTPPAGGPTASFPFPTGGAPFPTNAPFPTAPAGTGYPGLPTTLETLTRGARPTSAPDAPSQEDSQEPQNGNAWLDWVSDLLTGGKDGN
ncbi:uncharacterized protein EKO05_0011004 [Ascochyta rabiei]|uniref:Uncharacterized protein n=1 Tax=Didymella rabiei TaxID=5454 RepID=A0A163LIC6_DIDRA|nr:uncharacterized protein EKO05_0011004 [Ascochyta rabiei]KZM27823.1 hypothetical protein ST47_g1034 [Ascochyta rabiei]UPX20784.1 hypothetical protein EKO05_0011004 [Ascochyta rabiei]